MATPPLLRNMECHLQSHGRFACAGVAAQHNEVPGLHVNEIIQSRNPPGEIGGLFSLRVALQKRLVALAEIRDPHAGFLAGQCVNLVHHRLSFIQAGGGGFRQLLSQFLQVILQGTPTEDSRVLHRVCGCGRDLYEVRKNLAVVPAQRVVDCDGVRVLPLGTEPLDCQKDIPVAAFDKVIRRELLEQRSDGILIDQHRAQDADLRLQCQFGRQ